MKSPEEQEIFIRSGFERVIWEMNTVRDGGASGPRLAFQECAGQRCRPGGAILTAIPDGALPPHSARGGDVEGCPGRQDEPLLRRPGGVPGWQGTDSADRFAAASDNLGEVPGLRRLDGIHGQDGDDVGLMSLPPRCAGSANTCSEWRELSPRW